MASFQNISSSIKEKVRNVANNLVNGDGDFGDDSDFDYNFDDHMEADSKFDYEDAEEDEKEQYSGDKYRDNSNYSAFESDYEEDLFQSDDDKNLQTVFPYKKSCTVHTVEVAQFELQSQSALIYHVTQEIKRGAVIIIDFLGASQQLYTIWMSALQTLEFAFDAYADLSSPGRCILCPSKAVSTHFVAGEDKNLYIYAPKLQTAYDLQALNQQFDDEEITDETNQQNIHHADFRQTKAR